MIQVYIFLLMGSLIAATAAVSTFASDAVSLSRYQSAEIALSRASARLNQGLDRYALPTTINGLMEPGQTPHPWLRYAVQTNISDGTWTFDRAVVWLARPGHPEEEEAELLANGNRCGTGAFAAAPSFCLSPDVPHTRVQTNQGANAAVAQTKRELSRTMRKLLGSYYTSGRFPSDSPATGNFTVGTGYRLTQIVGYTGTSADCSGSFVFNAITFDCTDLFAPSSGLPIFYTYTSPSRASFYVGTRLRRADGQNVVIGTEAQG